MGHFVAASVVRGSASASVTSVVISEEVPAGTEIPGGGGKRETVSDARLFTAILDNSALRRAAAM